VLDWLNFWWRTLSQGSGSLNNAAGWLSLIVLVLGVAAGVTVPLVFHASHWLTAVIVMAAVVIGPPGHCSCMGWPCGQSG
jgi:hypothetical protein